MQLVLSFEPDGSVRAVHTDAFPLESLGPMAVRRASTVEFNEAMQEWEVRWPDSPTVVFRNASRSACIAWEVDHLNARLLLSEPV